MVQRHHVKLFCFPQMLLKSQLLLENRQYVADLQVPNPSVSRKVRSNVKAQQPGSPLRSSIVRTCFDLMCRVKGSAEHFF